MRNFYIMRSFSVGVVIFFSLISLLKAEGTKELTAGSSADANNFKVALWSSTNQSTRKSATFASTAEPQYRMNIKICNLNEVINLGFRPSANDIFFRLRKPDGTTVNFNSATAASGVGTPVLADQDPGALFCYRVPTAGTGFINAHSNAMVGPQTPTVTTGYAPLQVIADQLGDWYIEFNPTSATVLTQSQRRFDFFDITVWNNNTTKTPINGRLWTLVWDIAGDADYRQFIAKVYIYAKDSIVTSVSFNAMRPINFVITANSSGCRSTGNAAIDRKSRVGNINYPEYKLFLNDPDPACYPNRQMGCLTGPVTITGCDPENRCINIPVSRPGKVEILLDVDQTAPNGVGYDQNTRDTIISYNLVAGNNCIPWNSRGGGNSLILPGVSFGIEVNYFNGNTHLPMYDAENHPNGYTVELVRPTAPVALPGQTCQGTSSNITVYWDDETPTGAADPTYTGGTISSGPTFSLDGMTNFAGCNLASGCHRWINRGDNNGTVSNADPRTGASPPETMNTWWYANVIRTTTSYNVSTVDIDAYRLNPRGAKNDTTLCSNNMTLQLFGLLTVNGVSTPGTWSTNGGGSFSNSTLHAIYTLDPSDTAITGKGLFVVLHSPAFPDPDGAGPLTACPSVTDTLFIDFLPGPKTLAGPDQSACKNNPLFPLAGGIGGTTNTYQWSSSVAGGFFVPDAQTLNATYHPPASVTNATGNTAITLYLRSLTNTGSITCPQANDSLVVTYFAAPNTDAGTGYTYCNTSGSPVPLSGTINGGTSTAGFTINWTTLGSGIFTAGQGTLNPSYQPSAAEISAGTTRVVIHVIKTSAPNCAEVTDTATISLSNPPAVGAGFDFQFCRNRVDTIPLNANVSGVTTSTTWSCVNCSGGSFLGSQNNASAKYRPSSADLLLNSLSFVFTATSANCPPARDTIIVSMYSPATVNTGSDLNICKTAPCVSVNAVITGTGSGVWKTSGTGTFSPNTTSTSVTYCLTQAEINLGVTLIRFEVPTDGNCLGDEDSVLIFVNPSPKPFAGVDKTVCSNNAVVILSDATGAGTVTWTSLSASPGSFNTSSPFSSLHPRYTLSAAEISAGSATLVMAMVTGSCLPEYDTVIVSVTPAPTVSAGPDVSVCVNNPTVNLSGTLSLSTPNPSWTIVSGTTGTFSSSTSASTSFTATSPVAGGTTTVRLSFTGSGCATVTDDLIITYTPVPVITITSASAVTACSSNPNVPVSASFSAPATGLIWSVVSAGPAGSFLPNSTSTSTTYVPTPAQIASGSVTLRATSNGQGNCNAVNSTTDVVITYTQPPTVDAGTVAPMCENNVTAASLNGTFGAAVSGQTWTSSSNCSSCFSSTTAEDPTYTPSTTDVSNGSVLLTLTSTGGPNGCLPVSDTVRINFTKAPTVNAGPDLVVCTNQNSVALTGSASNSSSVSWSVLTGTGSVAAPTSLTTTYNISATDKTNGTVQLRLTANGNGSCAAVTDQVLISFTTLPTLNAGPDRTVCLNDLASFQLDGSGASGTWSTASPGVTIVSPTLANSAVTFTGAAAGQVKTFTYSFPAASGCPGVSDAVVITLQAAPIVTATSTNLCKTTASPGTSITLTGTSSTGTGFWITNGTGTIANANALATTYTVSPADILAGTVAFTFQTNGTAPCSPTTANATSTITELIISAGPNQNKCGAPGTVLTIPATLILNGTIRQDLIGNWSVTNAAGAVTTTAAKEASYTVLAGDAPLPKTLQFTINSTVSGCVASASADITLQPVPTAVVNPIINVCETATTITVRGTITGVATGTWSSNAGTVFSPNNIWSAAQTSVSYVVNTATDPYSITFTLTPDANLCTPTPATATVMREHKTVVNAGPDVTLCANNNVFQLVGPTITTNGGTTPGTWKASNGCVTCFTGGTAFSGATAYDADTNDISIGFVTLTLTSTVQNSCPADSDKVIIRYTPGPDVNAGPDRVVCANNNVVNLVGTVNSPFTATWSNLGGTSGTYSASADPLIKDFTPSAADNSNRLAVVVLTSSDPTGLCAPDRDSVRIVITPTPVLSLIVPSSSLCGDAPFFRLDADTNVVGTHPAGTWSIVSGGTGSFGNLNNSSDTAVYIPSAAERANGANITLRYETASGYCASESQVANLTFARIPTVNIDNTPADSITICANQSTISLSSTFTAPATGVVWSSTGSGTFVSSGTNTTSVEDPVYTFSNLDRLAGSVTFSVFSTGGPCFAVRDQYKVNIQPMPIVDAGADVTICQNVNVVSLADASVLNATGGTWTSTGTGSFDQTVTDITGDYFPSKCCVSPLDTAQTSVTLTLTSTGNGVCPARQDSKVISFTKLPVVNAGPDVSICADSLSASLSASASRNSGVTWSSPDAGTFAPSTSSLTPTFAPTAVNPATGDTLTAVVEAAGTGTCPSVRDTALIFVRPVPTISLGLDNAICEKDEDGNTSSKINIVSLVLTNATGVTWSTSGTGTFTLTPDPLLPVYNLTAQDIANGTVTISATTNAGIGTCKPVDDQFQIVIDRAPTVTVGPDIEICAALGANPIGLSAQYTNATGGFWTTSSGGNFNDPNADTTSIVGVPAAERNSGSIVKVLFTTIGSGACASVSDSLEISYETNPSFTAGSDIQRCYTATTGFNIPLNAGGIAGTWTIASGPVSGTFSPNANTPNAVFSPTSGVGDNVTAVLQFDPSDACYVGIDDINIVFRLTPDLVTPTAGNICETTPTVSVSTTPNAGSVLWSVAKGFGTLTNANTTNPTYNVHVGDKNLNTIRLLVTSTLNSAFCPQDIDTVLFRVIAQPVVNTGPAQTVCSDIVNVPGAISLSGSVTNAASFSWSSANGTPLSPASFNTTFTATTLPATVTLTGFGNLPCADVTRNVVISPVAAPVIVLLTSKDTCARLAPLNLSSAITTNTGTTGIWSKVPGNASGSFIPSATTVNGQYVPTAADTARGFVDLILTATNTGVCRNVYDDTVRFTLRKQPQINAGTDMRICSTTDTVKNITATLISGPTNVIWSTSGTGTFSAGANLITDYILSTADSLNGGTNLFVRTDNVAAGVPCPNDTDAVAITLSPTPLAIVNAGLDQVVCRDNPTAQLHGFIMNATGGLWSVTRGIGSLSSPVDLDADFQFNNPIVGDTIILTLTSTGQDVPCAPVVDDIVITFTPTPDVIATAPDVICASNPFLQLGDTIRLASVGQGVWSGGDGVFFPNKFTTDALYFPGPNDIAAQKVKFVLTSTNNGNCVGVFSDDTASIITPFTKAATSGTNVMCANAIGVSLNASATPSGISGEWKILSNGGSAVPPTGLSTFFTPSATDIVNQSASVRFVTTGGTCAQDSVTVVVAINPAPTVDADTSRTLCADVVGTVVPVSGTITVASGGLWTTSGTGSFRNTTIIGSQVSSEYIASAADTASVSNSVTLYLTTTGNTSSGGANCIAVRDSLVITFMPRPIVAASATNTCSDLSGVVLNGSVSKDPVYYPAASGQWSTPDGKGVFSPDAFTPNATYVPNSTDISNGMTPVPVHLVWSSLGAGTCNPVTDTIPVYFRLPTTNAGVNRITCNTTTNLTLTAIKVPGMDEEKFDWSVSGTPGILVSGQSVNITSPTSPTNYVLTMTDRYGCQAKDTVLVDYYTVPTNNLVGSTCYDYYLYVHLLTSPLPVDARGDIQWEYNDEIMSGEHLDSVRANQPGEYSAVYSLDACIVNYDSTIVNDVPHVLTPDFIACNGVGARINIIPVNSGTNLSFEWFPTTDTSAVPEATGNNPTTPLIIAPTAPRDTVLHYVVVEDNITGCKTKDSVYVIGVPVPRPMLIDTMTCAQYARIELNNPMRPGSNLDSLSIYNPTYAWYKVPVAPALNDTLSTAISYVTQDSAHYVFGVQVGQCNGDDTAQVLYQPHPVSGLLPDDTLCMDQAKLKTLDAGPGGTSPVPDNVYYAWRGPGATSVDTNRLFTVYLEDFTSIDSEDNEYHVLIRNEYSYLQCSTDVQTIIHDVCAPRVFPPTAFHPGDPNSMDAFFTIQGKYFTNFNLRVFNRWGEIIFQTNDANVSWDGTYRGEPMPIGVYAYTIVYEGKSDEYEGPFKKDGRVVLIR